MIPEPEQGVLGAARRSSFGPTMPHNRGMASLIPVLPAVAAGVLLGLYRGLWGWEMLSFTERAVIIGELAVIVLAAGFRLKFGWLLTPASLILILATYFTLFEPRFHMQFGMNGLTCLVRSLPASLATAAMLLLLIYFGRWNGPAYAIGLLAACSAILAQTLYCPIVESRHTAYFHSGQIAIWSLPVLLRSLLR